MDYDITVRVAAEENVIDIPWDDIEKDFEDFVLKNKITPLQHNYYKSAFKLVTSRIRNVFLDRCKNSLIQ